MTDYHHLRHEAKRAIENRVGAICEIVVYEIENGNVTTIEQCREAVYDMHYEDTLAIGLSHEDELSLVENHADDYGWTLEGTTFSDLRSVLESHACVVIDDLARSEVQDILNDLDDFLEDEELELSEATSSNGFGWAVHYDERSIGDKCQVYRYRNVEGEVHADVYEYSLDDYTIYFQKFLADDDLSADELAFDPH